MSTARQGRSGLGLESQRQALVHFAKTEGFEIVSEYLEIETAMGSDALDRRAPTGGGAPQARRLRCPVAVAVARTRLHD